MLTHPRPSESAVRRRRGPPPVLWLVGGVHLLALLAIVASPRDWPWALGAVLLSHAVVTALTLTPRTRWLGPNLVRLPADRAGLGEVALTIDDGPDPRTTPAVLDLLDAHGARASFFCIGERVARYPELARDIVRRGHRVENHTARHRLDFALLGPRACHDEVAGGQALILAATGVAPGYLRAPAGFRNPWCWPALERSGVRLASWTRRGFDTRDGDAARVLARLARGLAAGDILLLHDGHCARTPRGQPVILEVLPPLLKLLRSRSLHAVALPVAQQPGGEGAPESVPESAPESGGSRPMR